jgi:hypothetical protein
MHVKGRGGYVGNDGVPRLNALIQQMLDALCECAEDSQEQLDRMEAAKLRQYKPQAVAYQEATIDAAKRAITAARARLGEKT